MLLRATHLGPSVLVTAITVALAVGVGRGLGAVWVALAALAGQFSVGWANDWLDRGRDRALGRDDKPLVRRAVPETTVRNSALAAVAACAVLSLASGTAATAAHLVAVALGWAYNAWLKFTVGAVVAYAGAFALLPAFVTLGLPGAPLPAGWALVAGTALGGGAYFANALPDLAGDAATGVHGLAHRLGARGSVLGGAALLGLGAAAVGLGPGRQAGPASTGGVVAAVVCCVGLVVAGLSGRERVAFPLAMAAAAGLVTGLVAAGSQLT
jgi:4-hydroxybenzoate polyprenyltransferase